MPAITLVMLSDKLGEELTIAGMTRSYSKIYSHFCFFSDRATLYVSRT